MTADALPASYTIRRRNPSDDAALVRIENDAGALFADHGYPDLADDGFPDVASLRAVIAGNDVFVAIAFRDEPVGFAIVQPLGQRLHLRELAVAPAHGRRGVGTALVRHVIEFAKESCATGISLTTFRAVPFNAPFYAAVGFSIVDDAKAGPELIAAFHREMPPGIAPSDRVAMVLDFPA